MSGQELSESFRTLYKSVFENSQGMYLPGTFPFLVFLDSGWFFSVTMKVVHRKVFIHYAVLDLYLCKTSLCFMVT